MKITNSSTSTFAPCPEGVHSAVCVDCIDLGVKETQYGPKRKLRMVFEIADRMENGKPYSVSRSFTASLHQKATLSNFLSKWRGRAVSEGEEIDFDKLITANATLVVSHMVGETGKTFACIDAISKPTKKLAPSGSYDPAAARQRIAEYAAKDAVQASAQPAAPKPTPALAPSAVRQPKPVAAAVEEPESSMPF